MAKKAVSYLKCDLLLVAEAELPLTGPWQFGVERVQTVES